MDPDHPHRHVSRLSIQEQQQADESGIDSDTDNDNGQVLVMTASEYEMYVQEVDTEDEDDDEYYGNQSMATQTVNQPPRTRDFLYVEGRSIQGGAVSVALGTDDDTSDDDHNVLPPLMEAMSVRRPRHSLGSSEIPSFPIAGITAASTASTATPTNINDMGDDEFLALLRRIRETRSIMTRFERRHQTDERIFDQWVEHRLSSPVHAMSAPNTVTSEGTQTYSTEETYRYPPLPSRPLPFSLSPGRYHHYATQAYLPDTRGEDPHLMQQQPEDKDPRRSSVEMASFACKNGCCTIDRRICGCKLHHRAPHKEAQLNRDGEMAPVPSPDEDFLRLIKKGPFVTKPQNIAASGR